MQAHTKKRPIETVELRFIGPAGNLGKAIDAMKPLGFVDASDSIPWKDALPECSEEQLVGKTLAGARYRERLTQMKLAEQTGIPQRHISEMENGKRPIGKRNAKVLGKALNIGYKVFL